MRTVKGLKETVKGFGNIPVIDERGGQIIIKNILLQYLGGYVSPDKAEIFMAISVGNKIYKAKDSVKLEDAEFDFVSKTLQEPKHSAIIMYALYDLLGLSDKTDKMNKK